MSCIDRKRNTVRIHGKGTVPYSPAKYEFKGLPDCQSGGEHNNPWINHVTAYRAQHGGTYHDALKNAKWSYYDRVQ